MIQGITSQTTNCTPIKPHNRQSFGRNDAIVATAEWLEDIQNGDINEGSFRSLNDVAEKMHDGPLKTFVKILAIAGGTFVATKVGSSKVIKTVTNNELLSANVVLPLTKSVHNLIEKGSSKLEKSKYFADEQKGIKPMLVKALHSAIKSIKMYGQRGSEEIAQSYKLKINALQAEAKDAGAELKASNYNKIKEYKQRIKYAPTENLIEKVTSNTIGAGAGTVAIVEANRDADGNGIADIAEHDVD